MTVYIVSAYFSPRQLTVSGTMMMAGGSSVVLDTSQNGANTQLIVNGTLSMTGATVTYNYNQNNSGVTVNSNGHLVASNSTFTCSFVSLASGSVFNAGDLSGDTFNASLYVPSADVTLLSGTDEGGSGSDNVRFNDIDVTTDITGAPVSFNKIGTSNTSSPRYVFPQSTTVSAGSTLNVGAGVTVYIVSAYFATRQLTVSGTMTMAGGSSVVLDTSQNGANTQLIVNGTLSMTGATVTYNYNQNNSGVTVNSNGHLVASNSTFTCSQLSLNNGSSFTFIASNGGQTSYLRPEWKRPESGKS